MIFFSMSKGTKSFGHDKALACESRGFVYNKKGCIVLTHPLAVRTGLEPVTPCVTGMYSNQLN